MSHLNFRIEKKLAQKLGIIIAGIDEVGRGPIAGPIAVGAVVIDKSPKKNIYLKKIRDSKKITPKGREELSQFIKETFPYGIGMVSSYDLDRIGIVDATQKAIEIAIEKINPSLLLIDGNKIFPKINVPQQSFIKGDDRLFSIACASIIAKVARDTWMTNASKKWPKYEFHQHKGYGTKKHLEMLRKHGPCPIHRYSFAPLSHMEY